MENKKILPPQGDIRQLWAESFDKEMGRYLLMPIDNLTCSSCPGKEDPAIHGRRTVLVFLEELRNKIRLRIWLYAVGWIQESYAGKNSSGASQIVDSCIFIKEALTRER